MKGTYERTAADKCDEFLVAYMLQRQPRQRHASAPAMIVSPPVMEKGEWTIETSDRLTWMKLKFKLGEEFEEKTPDGREVKAVVTQEGDKLITVQTAKKEGQKSTKMTREFFDDKCVVTIEITGSDVVCTQTFTRR